MKPFLILFLAFWLIILAIGFWCIRHSLPIPGPEPKSADPYEEFAGRIVEAIIFPARWCGKAAWFVGAGLWAFSISTVSMFAWRWVRYSRKPRRAGDPAMRLLCLTAVFLAFDCATTSFSAESEAKAPETEKRIALKWPNGQPHLEETYRVDRKGRPVQHGLTTWYFENGTTNIQVMYADGRRNGRLTEWNVSGTIIRQGNFTNDLETGAWKWWQPTGEKLSECSYKDGKIVGKKISWFNGRLAVEELYDHAGELVQYTSWFHGEAPARMEKQGTFKNGKKHGRWTYWNPDGTVKAEGDWRRGKPWNGVCGIPVAGDAGSVGGLEEFTRYDRGRRLELK